jgi:hypothetical protein
MIIQVQQEINVHRVFHKKPKVKNKTEFSIIN